VALNESYVRALRSLDVRVLWVRLSERAPGKREGLRGLLCESSGWWVAASLYVKF
jgi:hypothetical protein